MAARLPAVVGGVYLLWSAGCGEGQSGEVAAAATTARERVASVVGDALAMAKIRNRSCLRTGPTNGLLVARR